MTKFYIAIKVGVYRHRTLGASLNKEDMLQIALDYFKDDDDYHNVLIEEIETGGDIVDVEEYSIKSERRYLRGESYSVIHGKRTVTNINNQVVAELDAVYELKEGESWAEANEQ